MAKSKQDLVRRSLEPSRRPRARRWSCRWARISPSRVRTTITSIARRTWSAAGHSPGRSNTMTGGTAFRGDRGHRV